MRSHSTMKVTVCFGPVKIIVPCGDGALSVRDLVEKSIERYRKALGKDDHYWVKVHSLQCQSDGAILDADDLVSDVADDREKLTALFEEEENDSIKEPMISDGTESSVGTMSPINVNELNHINNSNNKLISNGGFHREENGDMDIVVTGREAESRLKVRQNGAIPNGSQTVPRTTAPTRLDSNANTLPLKNGNTHASDEDAEVAAFDRFSRDSSRRSLSSAHPSVFKWAEAQQRLEDTANKDPTSPTHPNPLAVTPPAAKAQILIEMVNDGTPLGIHIIARVENEDGSGYGLVVHGIENGGRAAQDKRLMPGDHILAINENNITQETFDRAQEMMREAMRTPTVKLLIERDRVGRPTSPPKVPPVVPRRSPHTSLASPEKEERGPMGGPTSMKRLGRKLYIQLMKGPQGLGFSVTSRDNPILGKHPIYIKNILPNGAAIVDGRLKPGDRLIEVNGIEMTGKTQEEAVSILRSVKRGGVVNLVVSRQEPVDPDQTFPRILQSTDLASPDDHSNNPNAKNVLDFNIALNDTGSAGLGVSVKGKTTGGGTAGETRDLGIFIKSVMHGGAASKDGRLRPNDQLLYINEVSLVNMSNSKAMDTLRKAMSTEKSPRSTIRLMIARRPDMTETLHNALNKSGGEFGLEVSPDRGIDVDNRTMRIGAHGLTAKKKDTEWDGRSKEPPTIDDSSLLQNITEALSAKHNLSLSPRRASESGTQTEGRAHVIYPNSSVSVHPAMGSTLPTSREDKALIDNDGLQVQVDVSSLASTRSISPHSPRAPSPPEWLSKWGKDRESVDSEQLSPGIGRDQFLRESYARLSFSEKKKGGTLDAKEMSWYRKTKSKKTDEPESTSPLQRDVAASTGSLVRAASMDSLLDKPKKPLDDSMDQTGGMKKSSSMDRLVDRDRDRRSSTEYRPSRRRISRKNPLNNSFRAAVDKSLPGDADDDTLSVESASPAKDKKKKKKERDASNTGTNKGIKGFFRFGRTRKSSVNDDKDSDISKDEESSVANEEEFIQAEQERIQESLQRKREESEEARRKAERMMELKMRYEHQPEDRHPHRHHHREELGGHSGPSQEPIDRHSPRGDPVGPNTDARYERLSEGRSHPDPKYMGRRERPEEESRHRRGYDTYSHRDDYDNVNRRNYDESDIGNYDNLDPRKYDYDRRTHEPRGSDQYRGRGYDEDKGRYYQTERTRVRSEGHYREHDRPPARLLDRTDSQETSSSKEGRPESRAGGVERKSSDKKRKPKRESPTVEERTAKEEETKGGEKEGKGVGSIFRRGSKGGSKKEKKNKKERSDSEREEDKHRKPSEEASEPPPPDSQGGKDPRQRDRDPRSREDQWRHGRDGRDRPEDRGGSSYGGGRRHRSQERPSRKERRSEDWGRWEEERRGSRPYGGTERGPRSQAGGPRDVGSLDGLHQQDHRADHYRPRREDPRSHHPQDGRYPPRDPHRPAANEDPRYPESSSQQGRPIHQRSRSYDIQEFTNYGDGYEAPNPPFNPRTGYARDPHEDGYRRREDPARV